MRGRLLLAAIAAAMLACAAPLPAAAQTAVDLQLVLAVDASGSVDQVRFDLQKSGYVAAFRHARVLQAIRSGPHQAIAVTMVQWTGPMMQVQVAEWSAVGDERTAAAFAAAAAITCDVSGFPCNSNSVAIARQGPLPNPPIATRAAVQEPEAWRVTNAPALTTT